MRLEQVREFGATHTINASKENPVKTIHDFTQGRGVDFAFEAADYQLQFSKLMIHLQNVAPQSLWGFLQMALK